MAATGPPMQPNGADLIPRRGLRANAAPGRGVAPTLALCNEVVRELDFAAQCELAASLGYDALEVAPFTLAADPRELTSAAVTDLRRAAESAGIGVSSLHWLLMAPTGLSITTPDPTVRRQTLAVIESLVALCSDLGGTVLVHGSPQQRVISASDPTGDRGRAVEAFAHAAEIAERHGVTYCIEPLSTHETEFVTSVGEAAAVVSEIGSPALRTMLDARAARLSESAPAAEVLRQGLRDGIIAHVHLNDSTGLAPGQGGDEFASLLRVLAESGYDGTIAIEPFTYLPDGPTAAASAAGYVRGIWEAVNF